ncbi:uncharacterized protein LOC135073517 [Ostrinia nubilalis]|uniref:uncharacterized protein LOC135073517 n=1 Tax=Ostrinia nubilalis TaxID=29057 RepID=UPI0030823A4B
MLERWARCVKCRRSRKLMNFTAHCLRAPALHDKYRVHNILQVVLIVPPETPKTSEIINVLAKNAIQRGREVGFPLIRFDVSNDLVAKSLEELNLKKEWHLSYEIVPHAMKERDFPAVPENKSETQAPQTSNSPKESRNETKNKRVNGNYIAVYTAFSDSAKENTLPSG